MRGDKTKPLLEVVVWNTRPSPQAIALTRPLEALGATVIEIAATVIVPRATLAVPANLGDYDWALWTSATTVTVWLGQQNRSGWAISPGAAVARPRHAAIGKATAAALTAADIRVDLVADQRRAEGLLAALSAAGLSAGHRVLLLRAAQGRPVLPDCLRAAGVHVDTLELYDILPAPPAALLPTLTACSDGAVGWVALTSGAAIDALVSAAESIGTPLQVALGPAQLAVLGPVAAAHARELGLRVALVAPEADVERLAEAIGGAEHQT